MNLLRNFAFNKKLLSLITTSFFSLLIFFNNDSIYASKVTSKAYDVYSFFSSPSIWYKNILTIKKENELLSKEIVQLSLLNSKLINYEIENHKLREMLNYKESFKHLSLLPANVINSNFSFSNQSKIINVGTKDGITKDLAVIDIYGNLIGKIISAGYNNSKVQLITDNNFSVSVKIGQNISIGQFIPKYGKYGYLEGIIKTLDFNTSDIVYTSGHSEIYPPDLPVCKIISSKKKKNKLFQDVGVEILTDIKNLYYVFVIQ
tara:strand:- start:146 stop:928 length:783 start_codon:yes stop_codon:yes gene_type:complete